MGRIWMLGDNVNTDVIIPGRYNVTTDRTQLARYCLCEVLPEFAQQVRVGDVVIAGHNFGCGSSREHAPAALQACGVQVVIARSFARIFYRNAVNIGLPVLVCEEVVAASADGQDIELDLATGVIHNVTTGQAFQAEPLNPFVARIVAAGGIMDGRSAAAALILDASGVVMGTRFLAAEETMVPHQYREAILLASHLDQRRTG